MLPVKSTAVKGPGESTMTQGTDHDTPATLP